MTIITNVQIYTEDSTFIKGTIMISHGVFVSDQTSYDDVTIIDANGKYAIPGLCDIHLHACNGHDFCEASVDAIHAIAKYEAQNGITSFCPTTMTLPAKQLKMICASASAFQADPSEASLIGVNLEGPFLSAQKCGAQNKEYLSAPAPSLVRELNQEAAGLIRLITIAPELPGAIDFIHELKNDFMISAGHTMADYSTCMRAFDAGITHVTHLYHAMPPFSHRAPGLIGAAADTNGVSVELICDGIHSDPAAIRMAFKLFSKKQIILISDSMMATGLSDGEYTLGDQQVLVNGKLATLKDGTIAGSVSNLFDCLTNAVNFGIPLEDAVRCATMNPAKALGIYQKTGSIAPGKTADLLLLNQDLSLDSVFIRGVKLK